MVRPPSFDSNGMKKGAWSEDEDNKLRAYIQRYGHWNWRLLPKYAGLKRCGKSCRLRWVNYLKPGVKKGNFTKEEQDLIIKLHVELGNKWSAIASKLPGRTDNEIKNFWHTRVEKRRKQYPAAAKKPNSEASSSTTDATSLSTSQHDLSSLPLQSDHDHANEDQLDLILSDIHILAADHTTANYDSFFEEEFNYYPELSSSGSSYINNWAAEEDDRLNHRSFWNESSASNSECESSDHYTPAPLQEEGLPYYDPLLEYFEYDMTRFCYQP